MTTLTRRAAVTFAAAVCSALLQPSSAGAQPTAAMPTRRTITIRGHEQVLRVYGARGGVPVIVSSGDGGWMHLGPHVAEVLAAKGFFVVGFDAKAYLESFTNGTNTLRVEDEPGDYRVLIDFAAQESGREDAKPVLIGVSEGAGLSVLAATDPRSKNAVSGVLGLGLSDVTELGWRWKDMVIYLTHGAPREPSFSVKAVVDRVAPLPLAAIHSTRDEYVPLSEAQEVLQSAAEPKRLWIVRAANHRFSDNLAEFDRVLLEALEWITHSQASLPK